VKISIGNSNEPRSRLLVEYCSKVLTLKLDGLRTVCRQAFDATRVANIYGDAAPSGSRWKFQDFLYAR
jgi:hypothetical protein